jgi:hypothetical protein
MKNLSPIAAALLLTGLCTATLAAETITVKRATYRADQSYACDATTKVKEICQNKESCTVAADNNLCGDPKFGTPKKLIVEFSCGKNGKSQRADENTDLSIACD